MKIFLSAALLFSMLTPEAEAFFPGRYGYRNPCQGLQGSALWRCVNAPRVRPTPRSNRCAGLEGGSLWNCLNGPYNPCDEFRGSKRYICEVERERAPARRRGRGR